MAFGQKVELFIGHSLMTSPLIPPSPPLFAWQNFQTGRPPAFENRLNEFLGEFFGTHFCGERGVIVVNRHEFNIQAAGAICQDGVPNLGRAIVLRPPQHADVDELPLLGKLALPLDTGVGGEHGVGTRLIGERV